MSDALQLRMLGPAPMTEIIGTPTYTNHACDATNDGIANVFSSPTTDAITHVAFRYGARALTPPTYIIGLEGLDATGLPDGTYKGGGSPASATFTPPADTTWDGTLQWVALANSYTPTRDEKLALTIRHSSGSVDSSNYSSFTLNINNGSFVANFPQPIRLTAGSWTKFAVPGIYGIRTASNRYGPLWQSLYVTRTASTVGHRAAMKFTLPSGWGDTFKVKGVRFFGSVAGATGKAPVFGLWNASSALQNSTEDSDWVNSATGSVVPNEFYFDEATLSTLSFGTVYYAGLEVADAVNGGVIITGIQLSEANDLLAYPGGTSVHLATFDGSNWTDVQTVRPMAELILEDITEPAGGSGGMLVHPGMNGGLRG